MQVKTFDNIVRVVVPDQAEITPININPTDGGVIVVPNPPATTSPGNAPGTDTPGTAPVAVPVTNLALGTKLISGLGQPGQISSMPELTPGSPNVLQCMVRVDDTYLFSTQATIGSNGSRDPYETNILSRMKINGDLIDSMTLVNAGHGTSFVVEKSGSDYWIWFTWVSSNPKNQLVRFKYKAGKYNDMSSLPNMTIIPQFETGYNVYSADWDAGWLTIKKGVSGADYYILRRIDEFRTGVNKTYGQQMKLSSGPPSLQGFCTINGTFFRWLGAQNGEALVPRDPARLEQYSWATGQLVDSVNYPNLGKRADTGQFRDGVKEPESCTMWRDSSTGLANLTVGVTTGKSGNHRWPLFTFSKIGDKADLYQQYVDPVQGTPVQPTPTPDPVTGSTTFTIGSTKPTSSNVGLLRGSTKGSLTVVNGNITVTADNTVIRDKYVKGRILVRAKNVKVINCWVGGGAVPTGTNTAMIDCNSSAANGTQVSNCVLCPDTPNLWVNGIIGHDYTIRFCDIYNVVDGCGVYQNGDVNTVIEANYIHDLAYFTNDPNHSDNHTHNDGIQMQGGNNLTVRGNNVQAFANPNIGNYNSNPYRPAVTGQAFAGTPNVKQITGLDIRNNWMDGGANTLTIVLNKFAKSNLGTIKDNKFGRGQNSGRVIVIDPTFTVSLSNNTYEDNGAAVKVVRAAQ